MSYAIHEFRHRCRIHLQAPIHLLVKKIPQIRAFLSSARFFAIDNQSPITKLFAICLPKSCAKISLLVLCMHTHIIVCLDIGKLIGKCNKILLLLTNRNQKLLLLPKCIGVHLRLASVDNLYVFLWLQSIFRYILYVTVCVLYRW